MQNINVPHFHVILKTSFIIFLVFQVWLLEFVRLAPAGSVRVSSFLERAAAGLVDGGRFVLNY